MVEKLIMWAVIASLTLWFIVVSGVGFAFGILYNRFVERKVDGLIPPSVLVAGGVTITEILRVARMLPVVVAVAHFALGVNCALAAVTYVAVHTADAIAAYAVTGLPMICGNLFRERAKQRDLRQAGDASIDKAREVIENARSEQD